MTEQLVRHLQGKDPSLPLAVAALLSVADRNGSAPFGQLAVAYREDHLSLYQGDRGEAARQSGTLSVDQVRRHLEKSVLPRLVMDGVLESLPAWIEDSTPVQLRLDHWAALPAGTGVARAWFTRLAAEAAHSAETAGAKTVAAGSVLSARGLTKSYRRRRVVDQVDIEVKQGEIVGLLGPNGAGKTTTFYMIVGLIRPDAGRILLDDGDITGMPMYKRARRGHRLPVAGAVDLPQAHGRRQRPGDPRDLEVES